jgi:beta-glucosidase
VLQRVAEEHPDHPLLVAELGIGTDDEAWRESYLRDALAATEAAVAGGVDVRGVFLWTGIDNYEWHRGFDVRFGLFDRDRAPRPALDVVREAIAATPSPG